LILSLLVIGAATGAKILLEDIPMVGKGTGLLTLVLSLLAVGLLWTERKSDDVKGIEIERSLFSTDRSFNLGAFAVMLILLAIYAGLW
jgi:SSS family solute:Na+ symporter